MAADAPIVITRRPRGAKKPQHHAGAWKIAYADFVTAMMAFFLLMWLLGSTTSGDLKGIAEYFQSPLRVLMSGGTSTGDGASVVKGGGTDLTRQRGNVRRGEVEAARAELEQADATRMRRLQQQIEDVMRSNPALSALRQQMRTDVTPDGLRIQIVDDQGRPMFDAGSAHVKHYMRELLQAIGMLVNKADGYVVLSGHTDASAYAGGERGYSNWELSADRANASRRELLAGGLREDRVVRVLGLGSSAPADRADPYSPLNRRITVLVLGAVARERWQSGAEAPVSEAQALERILERMRPAGAPAAPTTATPSSPSGAHR